MKEEDVEVQLCLQCGSMDWSIISEDYQAHYRVRLDGHVEFEESFEGVEYMCSKCGAWTLLGIAGLPNVFQELVKLEPVERVLRALELIVEGGLKVTDETGPKDVLDWIENFALRNFKDKRDSERFLSEVRRVVARWKLVEQ